MNYAKLTVDGFKARLEAGDYQGLTGARRAIGKVQGWTEKDRNAARKLADEYFAKQGDGGKGLPKKAASSKPIPKKAAAKKPAAAKPAPAAPEPKPAPKKAAPKKAASSRTAAPAETPRATERAPQITPAAIQPAPAAYEDGVRANAAATVIQVMRGTGPLSPLEQRTYHVAMEEFFLSAREAARRAVEVANNGVPVVTTPPTHIAQPEHVVAPIGSVPRIPLQTQPNGTAEGLTPEQQQQFERLKQGAVAVPAILGTTPPDTQS